MYERTIWWNGDHVEVLDQRLLPHEVATVVWRRPQDAADGIATMQVRGAPLIGVAAAHGMALAMALDPTDLDGPAASLLASRPTAVNLRWAVERMVAALTPLDPGQRAQAARRLSLTITEEDVAACRAIGDHGVSLLREVHERTGRTVQVLTHCNAGRLACVEWGTATAPVYVAAQEGIPVHVWVSETRPRNQGASLTAWELVQAGIPHTVVVDNAAGHLLASGRVDLVLTGADRIAANGDSANKIGTYLKAAAARDCGVPFHIAAPASTYDARCPDGAGIPIEERDGEEVLVFAGQSIAPLRSPARNWGFDVTPARLVDSWITDRGVLQATDLPMLDG